MSGQTTPREPAPAWVLAPVMSCRGGKGRAELESWVEEPSMDEAMRLSISFPESVKWGVSEVDLLNELDEDAPFGTTWWTKATETHGCGSSKPARVRVTKSECLRLRPDAPIAMLKDILSSIPGKALLVDNEKRGEIRKAFAMEWAGRHYTSKDGTLVVTDGYGNSRVSLRTRPVLREAKRSPSKRQVVNLVCQALQSTLYGVREDLHKLWASLGTSYLTNSATNHQILQFVDRTIRLAALTDKWRKPGREELDTRAAAMSALRDKWRQTYPETCVARKGEVFKTVDGMLTGIIKNKGRIKPKERNDGKRRVEHGEQGGKEVHA